MAKRPPEPSWRIALTVVLGIGLLLFWNHPVLWPFKILVVMFHELSHAIAAWITGGEVVSIGLSADQGGVTRTRGGMPFIILNAGYLGSMLWGIGLLAASKHPSAARPVIFSLGALLSLVTLAFVRPIFSFGFGFSALIAGLLLGFAARGTSNAASLFLQIFGTFSVLYALFDVRDDIFRWGDAGTTDATLLAVATGVPAPVWGVLWLAVGIAALWGARRWL